MPRVPILLIAAFALCTGPVPGNGRDISRAGLDGAWAYSAAHNGYSLLVIQDGRTLLERHTPGDTAGTRHKIYSGTKALWCVAALVAREDGLLTLDEPVSATITEWRRDPTRARITIRQLLNFTAGIDPGFHLHSDDVPDRDTYAIHLPQVAPPGERFIYGPGQIQVFCEVLRRKLAARGGEQPWHYLQRHLLKPLGLPDLPHKTDATGNPLMASGIQMTAREWARFGACLLGDGKPILKNSGLSDCCACTQCNPAFGMGLWLNGEAPSGRVVNIEDALEPKWWQQNWTGVCLCPDAPRDLFVSLGSMGQRLYVVPSMHLIIVRLSADSKFSDSAFLRTLFAN
jgi:CubicO group peptidase (beta-lactamase class C family)